MKKFLSFLLAGLLALTFISCAANPASGKPENTAGSRAPDTGTSSEKLSRVATDVSFREGTAADGKLVLSSSDIAGFYSDYDQSNHLYRIVFRLTKSAKDSFAKETEKLSQSGGTLSIWAGKDRLKSASVYAQIRDGEAAVSSKDKTEISAMYKKIKGTAAKLSGDSSSAN